eukprot:8524458-Pyramimonas_sp.AAC.1
METEPTPTAPAVPPTLSVTLEALSVTSEERADPTTAAAAAAEEVVDLMPLRVKINPGQCAVSCDPAAPDEMFTVQVRPPRVVGLMPLRVKNLTSTPAT